MSLVTVTIPTPDGVFTATCNARGLIALSFPAAPASRPKPATVGTPSASQRNWLETTRRALLAVLAGKRPTRLPPLDLTSGTPFQKAVWEAMTAIPAGKTRTYGGIARAICRPRAVRAVGQACGANPVPVLVPCHRVLAAGGRLGGFSGGLDWKLRLLEREGVIPPA
jgi:O-6-methylguanine DNA methyltransferase